MPGNCPAWLPPSAVRLWKTFRSKPNTIPLEGRKCSPSERNGVRLHNGIAFAFDRIPHLYQNAWVSAADTWVCGGLAEP